MKIIIAGAGDVGFHLANLLSKAAQDIYLIDVDQDKLNYAQSHLDIFPVRGKSSVASVLEEANVGEADLLVAVTNFEETNILTAAIGKKLGAHRTIARVQNREFVDENGKIRLSELGVDYVISPRELLVQETKRLIDMAAATDSFDFAGTSLSLLGIVLEENSPIIDKSIVETANLNPSLKFLPIAIQRDNKTLIPRGPTVFRQHDHVYFITHKQSINEIALLSGCATQRIRNIMILGGGTTGELTAKALQKEFNVKLVEKDKSRSFELVENLDNSTMVIHADGRDVEALEEEGIADMDAFIALTGDSETNIISCLVAKNHKVPKTIALVENIDYINISQNIGIDAMINRKLIAANNIFRHVRSGDIVDITSFHGVDAEIIEFVAKQGSKIVSKPIRELNFPHDALVGGLVRGSESYIVTGDVQVEMGDLVVVFCMPSAIGAVEKLFK